MPATPRASCLTSARPQRKRFRGRGEGAYRAIVHSFFIFITETVGGPLRATERCRAIPSGIDRTHHWVGDRHTGPGLLESFFAAELCRALERTGIRIRREIGIPAMYKSEPLTLGFRADILADEIVILEIKAAPALLPAHDIAIADLFAHEPSSGRSAVQLPRTSPEGWPAALRRLKPPVFSVAHRGPRSAFVSKNPWPDTHSGTKWRDTEQRYNSLVTTQQPHPASRLLQNDGEDVRSTRARTGARDGQPVIFNDADLQVEPGML
jgi:GxxExxY protein